MQHETLTTEELRLLTDVDPSIAKSTRSRTTVAQQTEETASDPCTRAANDSALFELHRDFAPTLQATLSERTQAPISVRLRDATQGTFGQFVFGQPVPTCCAIVRAEPLEVEFFVALHQPVLFAMFDHILGSQQFESTAARPLTEIEQQLAKLLLDEVLTKYAVSWQRSLSLQLSVQRIEHNVQRLYQMVGATQTYSARYQLDCQPEHGPLEICIPWLATQQIRERLAANESNQ